ncbi:hypothetical protein [Bradyrhizobium sp.]|uniref:hypothetical protein n=1 Tax=Bradyrhizobium sp. TaxID=376 RepID=UPI003C33C005
MKLRRRSDLKRQRRDQSNAIAPGEQSFATPEFQQGHHATFGLRRACGGRQLHVMREEAALLSGKRIFKA